MTPARFCPTEEGTTDPIRLTVRSDHGQQSSQATPGHTPAPAAGAAVLQTWSDQQPMTTGEPGTLLGGRGAGEHAVSETQDCVLLTPRRH